MIHENYIQRKGPKILKQVSELYLHSDIGCGIENCKLCDENPSSITLQDTLYIISHKVLKSHLQVLLHSERLNSLVLSQHSLSLLNKEELTQLHDLQEHSRIETYLYPTLYSAHTYVSLQQSIEEQYSKMDARLFAFYENHLRGTGCEVILLDDDNINQYELGSDFFGISPQDLPQVPVFSEFLSEATMVNLVKTGELLEGRFWTGRIRTKYGFEVVCEDSRVLPGDLVTVRLIPNKFEDKVVGGLEDGFETNLLDDTPIQEEKEVQKDPQMKDMIRKIMEEDLTPHGQIQGVLKRRERYYCGHLEIPIEEQELNQKKVYQFVPADHRVPKFLVQTCNQKKLYNQKIQIKFDYWPVNSKYPLGIYKQTIGKIGSMDAEQKVILLEHEVEFRPFTKAVLECLPKNDYTIPQEEIEKRVDLRDIHICSVDPPGCKDIDDALHCRRLDNGLYEVGIHIADVSHFVKPDTAIDREAASRCTTVYLVDRRTDMLPKLLTETLCSLRDDGDRLAFSSVFVLDKEGTILESRFHKSVIRSKKALTYQEAQERIDDKKDNSILTESLRDLLNLAVIIKSKRNSMGALTLASTQVKFTFDQETQNPTDVAFYHSYPTNYMVEEFMLLANIQVAQKIFETYPASAILRKHSSPKPKEMKDFAKLMTSMGYSYNYDTSKQLQESLNSVDRKNDPFFNKLVRIMTTRTMNEANYFCTADFDFPEFNHYGLACSLYTHFTSPIRRYADVLVHRLLSAAIDCESLTPTLTSPPLLTKQCFQLNLKNRNARNASRASSDYHQYLFFQNNPVTSTGYITSISGNEMSVLLEKYGLEGKMQVKGQTIEQDGIPVMNINGNIYKIFDPINVNVRVNLQGFKKIIHMEIV